MSKKKKQNVNEGMIMISSLLPVGPRPTLSMRGDRKDNFVFKGLPGQFDKDGNKILDEYGDTITERLTDPDYKYYKKLLADVEDGLSELVAIGEDYEVFQAAKDAHKKLKQAYKLVNSVK